MELDSHKKNQTSVYEPDRWSVKRVREELSLNLNDLFRLVVWREEDPKMADVRHPATRTPENLRYLFF